MVTIRQQPNYMIQICILKTMKMTTHGKNDINNTKHVISNYYIKLIYIYVINYLYYEKINGEMNNKWNLKSKTRCRYRKKTYEIYVIKYLYHQKNNIENISIKLMCMMLNLKWQVNISCNKCVQCKLI